MAMQRKLKGVWKRPVGKERKKRKERASAETRREVWDTTFMMSGGKSFRLPGLGAGVCRPGWCGLGAPVLVAHAPPSMSCT
jgi:hypothetical protein